MRTGSAVAALCCALVLSGAGGTLRPTAGSDQSKLMITEGPNAPVRQLAHLEPDGSLVFDLKPKGQR